MASDDRYIVGDIWRVRRPRDYVVVPTNIGWTKDGKNPMGRGVAGVCARKYVDIPTRYGDLCRLHGADTPTCVYEPYRLIFYPTKPLGKNPGLSWKSPASMDLVRKSRVQLVALLPTLLSEGRVLIPAVGCGEGGLDPKLVVPELLELCEYNPKVVLILEESVAVECGLAIPVTVSAEGANLVWGLR